MLCIVRTTSRSWNKSNKYIC